MKKLLEIGNQYARESDWTDFALVKICLCAMGIAIGAQVSPKYRRAVTGAAAGVCVAAYIPLMARLFAVIFHKDRP